MFKIIVNSKELFNEKSDDILDATGELKAFEVSSFSFSTLHHVANIREKIVLVRDEKVVFKGFINNVLSSIDSKGAISYKYDCKDFVQRLNETCISKDVKEFKSVTSWINFVITEFIKDEKSIKILNNISNNQQVELDLKVGTTILESLHRIKELDTSILMSIDYEKETITLDNKIGKHDELIMWKDVCKVQEIKDGTDLANSSYCVSEWQVKVPVYERVKVWVSGGKYLRGSYDDRGGQTQLVYDLDQQAGDLSRHGVIHTHVDTAGTSENYKDWVGIFGYDYEGTGAFPLPYPNHRGLDFGYQVGRYVCSPPFFTRVIRASNGWNGGLGNSVVLETTDSHGQKVFNHGVFTYGHFEYISDRGDMVPGGILPPSTFIGLMGTTGNSTGVHLHLMVEKNGVVVDAYPYMFNVSDDWGWSTFVQNGHWETRENFLYNRYDNKKIEHLEVDKNLIQKYGTIAYTERDNSYREQAEVKNKSIQNKVKYVGKGLSRSLNIELMNKTSTRLNDIVSVKGTSIFHDNEQLLVVGKTINLYDPHLEKITTDNQPKNYLHMLANPEQKPLNKMEKDVVQGQKEVIDRT